MAVELDGVGEPCGVRGITGVVWFGKFHGGILGERAKGAYSKTVASK